MEPVEDDSVVSAAIAQILRESGGDTKGVYLSAVGQRLSSHFGLSLRDVLKGRKLRRFVDESLGELVKFEGIGSKMTVRIDEEAGSEQKPLRFDATFWAAFAKPIEQGLVRCFHPIRPFRFKDVSSDNQCPSSDIVITDDYIPDVSAPKPERDKLIREMIDNWCAKHDVNHRDFLIERKVSSNQPVHVAISTETEKSGVQALIAMAEAIPVNERRNFSLSFDLIYQLVKG